MQEAGYTAGKSYHHYEPVTLPTFRNFSHQSQFYKNFSNMARPSSLSINRNTSRRLPLLDQIKRAQHCALFYLIKR